jgi:hypothetical protein
MHSFQVNPAYGNQNPMPSAARRDEEESEDFFLSCPSLASGNATYVKHREP